MAHANKRITVTLAIVAFLFILTIILLIIPYEGSSGPYKSSQEHLENDSTTSATSPSKASTTPPSTTSATSHSATSPTPPSTTSPTPHSTTSPTPHLTTPVTSPSTTPVTSPSTPSTISTMEGSSTSSSTMEIEIDTSSLGSSSSISTFNSTTTPTDLEYTESSVVDHTEETTDMDTGETTDMDTGETTDMDTGETTDMDTGETTDMDTGETTDRHTEATTDRHTEATTNMTSEITDMSSETTSFSDYNFENETLYTTLSTEDITYNTTLISTVSTTVSTEVMATETTIINTGSTTVSPEESTAMSKPWNTHTCDSPECKQLSASMLGLMKHTVNPCQDFYQYACGNGVDNPYLRPVDPKDAAMTRIKESVLSSAPDNPARVLYESCMNKETPSQEDRIAYIRDLVLDFGEFDPREEVPKNNKSQYNYIDDKPFNLTLILAKMMKHHFTPLFDLTLDVDDRNTSQFILRLTPPLFNSPLSENIRKNSCLKDYNKKITEKSTNDLDELYVDYKACSTGDGPGIAAYTESISESINKMDLLNMVHEEFRGKLMRSILFDGADGYAEEVLQQFPNPSDLHLSIINRDYKLYTLQEMDTEDENMSNGKPALHIQNFTWHGLVEELLDRKVNPATTEVQVYFPEHLAEVLSIQNENLEEGLHKLRNILLALWSQYLYNSLIEPVGHSPHTEDYCIHLVTELLPDVTTQLYLDSFDQESLKMQMEKVKIITELVKEAFNTPFTSRSNGLIEIMKQKLELIKFDIGEKLNEDYQQFIDSHPKEELNKNKFPRNVVLLLNRYRSILYSFYEKDPNSEYIMWLQSNLPYNTAGSSSYPLNSVLIPIGSVESPLYEQNGPDLINFAGLGKMISHKLIQALDATVKSNLNATNLSKSLKQCQKDQLSEIQTFNINDVSAKGTLPVELVLKEALYDSNAVQLAWDAYITNSTDVLEVLPWLDSDPIKQFYLRAAQMHCEKTSSVNLLHLKESEQLHSSLRVNHMARNDPFFKRAFSCPSNSPMKNIPQCSYIH